MSRAQEELGDGMTLSLLPMPGHLEVEDAGVAVLEALAVRDDSVQQGVIEGEGGDGSQEPAVPWEERAPCQAHTRGQHPGGGAHAWEIPGAPWARSPLA